MTEAPTPTERVARLFDELAPSYDQSGVDFFRPIAARLVELLEVRPGERALDLGCGRGAATFPLAAATGPEGSVTAVDVAPGMVELTRAQAERDGVANVEVAVMDAAAPTLPERHFDVVASSLVLFFLPDPKEALARWVRLVAPGGRIGISTFAGEDPVLTAVDDLFRPYLPPQMLDARTSGQAGPFASDEGLQRLLSSCGAATVRTVTEPLPVVFDTAETWRAFSMSVGQRAMWRLVPAEHRDRLFADASRILAQARRPDGRFEVVQQVRYTLGEVR